MSQARSLKFRDSALRARRRAVRRSERPHHEGTRSDDRLVQAPAIPSCDIFLAAHGRQYNLKPKYENLGKGPNPFIDPRGIPERTRQLADVLHREPEPADRRR